MTRFRILSLLALAGLVASCDAPTGPSTGAISIALVTEAGLAAQVRAGGADITPEMRAATGDQPNVLLDQVTVRVTGPTTKEITSSTPAGGFFNVTVDGLAPGAYTVQVIGLSSGQVAHLGESAATVQAGKTANASVTFPVFQPGVPNAAVMDTVDVLRFPVNFNAVTGASGYRVEWSTSSTFATGVSSKDVSGTTTEVAVTAEGKYYVRVRALSGALVGVASPTKTVYVFQGVATVTVTPASPITIAAGATQQLTATAKDADGVDVTGVNWFWSSSNQAVALVSSTGLVTGVAGGTVTITALGKGTPGNSTFNVTARPAAKLAIIGQPTNTAAGATIPAIRVAVQDATGATVTGDNTTQVTLAIGTNAAGNGTITGLATVSAVAGIATFNNLSIAQAGTGYTVIATATGLTSATSANFDILPGAATQLAFTVQPSATAAGAVMSPAVQVTVRDALGNRVTSSSAAITLALGTNPSSGTLTGTKTVNAVSGVASFSGLSIDNGGTGYTLTAAASGLTGATSGAFDVGAALPASVLVFSIQPASSVAGDPLSPAIQVEIRNANGERVRTARDAVTLSFGANPGSGTLSGTKTVNAIDGIASFTGLSINRAATGYTLAASASGLTGATSSTFAVSPNLATKLRFISQPANAKGNVAQASNVTVGISDAYDNIVTSATSNVTLAIGNNPWRSLLTGGGGTLTATAATVAAVAGVATFTNVRIDKPGVGYTLVATGSGVTAATSTEFNVNVVFDGAIAAGTNGSHTCAISTESGTYCWGANGQGQLGALTGPTNSDSIPALVQTGGLVFTKISTGANHSCGLTAAGAAYCWGYNFYGQLGNNTTTNSSTPVAVSGPLVFASIEAGYLHTCGVTTANATAAIDRQVYCWGNNDYGQLGNATNTQSSIPVRVSEPLQTTTRAAVVVAGIYHSCAIGINSVAYCWGYNGYGQLGTADLNTTNANVPTQVHAAGTYTWTSITAGAYHTCGISSNGGNIARCWGYNFGGSVGDNSTTTRYIPTAVAGNLTNWTRITAGNFFTCGSTTAFTQCWGENGSGQLGNDDPMASSLTPVLVVGNLAFTSLDAGANHVCGKTGTGATSVMYCWGTNGNGRLGSTGVNQIKRAPTLVVQ